MSVDCADKEKKRGESINKEIVSGILPCLRAFQQEAQEKLDSGSSVLISAPTGLGKTRAAIAPFVSGYRDRKKLGVRIIYTLPIRALAKGIKKEFSELGMDAIVHHGEEPASEKFRERAVITTVDQYFTAFAGAPLSWAFSLGHAVSGATLASYTVFDEVHLLSPQKGLPLLFAIVKLRCRWALPTTVMTATLPDSVIEFLTKYCYLEKIEASETDIHGRDNWRRVSLEFHNHELDDSHIINLISDKCKEGARKIIVFVNTVDKAIVVYRGLVQRSEEHKLPFNKNQILLAHSRFTTEHRKSIEEKVHRNFGKDSQFDSQFDGILVTTQVAEAGLNISAPLVITELSPMDSLIQRAGRCARFKPQTGENRGEVIVIKPKDGNWPVPYIDSIRIKQKNKLYDVTVSKISEIVLKDNTEKPIRLDWGKERQLLNNALSDIYRVFIDGKNSIDYDKNGDLSIWKIIEKHGKELEGNKRPL